jgi:hypothetical protein
MWQEDNSKLIEGICVHVLRLLGVTKTYINNIATNGYEERIVEELLFLKEVRQTQRYPKTFFNHVPGPIQMTYICRHIGLSVWRDTLNWVRCLDA